MRLHFTQLDELIHSEDEVVAALTASLNFTNSDTNDRLPVVVNLGFKGSDKTPLLRLSMFVCKAACITFHVR